ncbi:MAG: cupin-like domain-containing protein [Actinobacteria bacterium]|nr:cupin-like domain-containing protein [Actinomycetota bacterium]
MHGEGLASDRQALARCVGDPESFRAHWGRAPLFSPADSLPRGFDDLLDLEVVDELLSRRGLRTPFLRLAKDGVVIDASRFTRPGGVGAEIGDQVDEQAVAALFADGATAVLQGLHRMWPPIIDFAIGLGGDLGHPVQVNAYITPPSSRGFSAHYDLHDVFVLQIAGEKRWIVHEPVLEAPLRSQPWTQRRAEVEAAAETGEPVVDVLLTPGDALYLPRGFLHAAEALGEVSAHLTVGVHVHTRQSIVQALVELAEDELELRRSLPPGIDVAEPGDVEPELEAVLQALRTQLESASAADVAEKLRSRAWRSMRPGPLAPLLQASAMSTVLVGDEVRLRAGLRAILRGEASPRLVLPDRVLDIDPASASAVRALLDGGVAEVGDDGGNALPLDLAQRLLREGVVVPAGA